MMPFPRYHQQAGGHPVRCSGVVLAGIIVVCFLLPAVANDSSKVEWLFENTFEKEYLTVNEAVAVMPRELDDALRLYHKGAYRRAADILYQVRILNLPDGNLDFIAFALAECYRQLDLQAKAFDEYRFVASRFPDTDKRAPSLFRMLEFSVRDGSIELVDSIRNVYATQFRNHPLYSSVLYRSALLYFQTERFGEAIEMLDGVPPSSARHLQARFLSALCHVELTEWDQALLLLDYVADHARDPDMFAEAVIVAGDIHYRNKRNAKALVRYRKVQKKSSRYEYALVKIARCLFDSGKFDQAVALGRKFLKKRSESDCFFEMASILEQALSNSGREEEAGEIGSRIHTQITGSRITFEIFDEIDRLTDLAKKWQVVEYRAIASQDTALRAKAIDGKKRCGELQKRLRAFLNEVNKGKGGRVRVTGAPHLAERRYLAILKKEMRKVDDSLGRVRQRIERIDNDSSATADADSTKKTVGDSLWQRYEELEQQYRDIEHEHALVIDKCLGGEAEGKRESEEMQAKFIDWEFMKYLEKKQLLVDMSARIAERKKKEAAADTTSRTTPSDSAKTSVVTMADRARLERAISDERSRLIDHMETMADIYPKSRYTPATLFRLAELFMDDAAETFQEKMAAYERQLVSGTDTGDVVFPEYDLRKAITTYRKITKTFPNDRYADDALFYQALALRKQGLEDSAHAVMVRLVEEYPQSEYYIEANMNIGRYHFEHPKKFGNDGYKLAEAAFRNVLFFRDHPQFVQALYHLGWCYYMQDRYDEAIAAFKYLIEEVALDFDPLLRDDKEVKNPLLRSEAIDYLAISFDQEGDSARASEFLKLIGNNDYAAMIFNRMGELREEDLDFNSAIAKYRKLLADYPLSYAAPEASARLIALYENAGMQQAAAVERMNFFNAYAAGSEWYRRIADKDTVLLQKTDSMVISIGLSIADNYYRAAEAQGGDDALLRKAAEQYRTVVTRYPREKRAADAAWNLAAILEKIGDNPGAYGMFLELSGWPGIDSTRREQAALNAIAIAQSLLPADSLARKGAVDFAGKKLIEAVDNYTKLFPEGDAYSKVLFTMAGVYFNRQLFDKAADVYRRILATPAFADRFDEATLLLAQCRFGQEQWAEAASLFEKVWKQTADSTRRETANTFLLQSLYFDAKAMLADKKYEKAAAAFKAVDDRFPGSEYGDVALFSAAGAWEKNEKWTKACDRYFDLVERYPSSTYAPDALFNAAGNYEKADKYMRAAETYELLFSRYPESTQAKDGLFNLGFCYEKLGKVDKMVEANERYSLTYPEEKDVEALLIRSADYYAKNGMLEKAINLYRNFVRRFPQSPKTIEAYYMIGKCFADRIDIFNAQANYRLAEQHNSRLLSEGGKGNLYFASEAALALGRITSEQFSAVKLQLPEERLQEALQEKSGLMKEAAGAYQRVVQYHSEKMFEAGCRIGELYEELAEALVEQERMKSDPIKAALKENEIMTAASQLERTSFVPYRKVLELAAEFDSLGSEQQEWVDRARENLSGAVLQAGAYLYQGVGAMQDAPVPDEIRSQPLLYYQYRIKLLETLEPLKVRVLDYFTEMLDTLPKLGLDDSLLIVCEINVARLNYLIGSAGDRLAVEILKETEHLPKSLSEDEREDLLFQLEDIVFELQDKALLKLEAARERLLQRRLHEQSWYGKIIQTLARLSPEKYGASFYKPVVYVSDESWFMRQDSVADWRGTSIDLDSWLPAARVRNTTAAQKRQLPRGVPLIGGKNTWKRMYLWKNLFCEGTPRDAKMKVCIAGSYRLYINSVLTLSDTSGGGDGAACDSATGIVSLFRGGDNILACEVTGLAPITAGIGMQVTLLVDTTEQFATSLTIPKNTKPGIDSSGTRDSTSGPTVSAGKAVGAPVDTKAEKTAEKMSRRELYAAIEKYRQREREALAALRKERLAVQRLKILREERERKRKSRKFTPKKRETGNQKPPLPAPLE